MTESTKVPAHVGLILDGNRRWARARGVSTLEGHRQGAEVFKEIALATFDKGVKYLSAFVFSTENWQRTEEEVGYLMKLVVRATEKYLDTFHDADIKIVILGRRDNLKPEVVRSLERTEAKTANNTRGTLALCFNYGGQEELVDVFKGLIEAGVKPDEITTESISEQLYSPEVPPVDLLIRTSGEQRLSGFMLYRAAYSELYFTEKLWPDFTPADLDAAVESYINRERRFGN